MTRRLTLAGCLGFAVVLGLARVSSAAADVESLRDHVGTLASAELEGRLTGSPGEEKAAEYLVQELTSLGVLPLPDRQAFRLPFAFTAGVSDAGSAVTLATPDGAPATYQDEVRALSFSDSAAVSGGVVFAGYGLSVPESQGLSYDSYVGLDVEDKIVVVLRYFPEDVEQDVRTVLSRYSGLRYKALIAREKGAAGLLVITGPRSPNAGEPVPMSFDTAISGSGIVAASGDGRLARALFDRAPGKSLEDVQKELDTGNPHLSGFAFDDLQMTLSVKVAREKREGHNVVGFLPALPPGSDGETVIVVGAHYDHLGRGGNGNSLAKPEEKGRIHYGADDNASGVAAALEVAARLAKKQERSRPVVFAFWSGEELGLLGSSDFLKEDLLSPDRILAYVNLDMVGRMKDNRLVVQATGTSPVWPRLIEQANVVLGFDVRTSEDPYLPTDVMSFNQAGVPSINLFTGGHEDYHRPTDTASRIDYEDLDRVARFGGLLVEKLMKLEERPAFVRVERPAETGPGRASLRAFTGTIPDYTTEVEGLRLSGVIEGGPAAEAGLREGDVIVEFAGQTITNIYDYTYALDAVKIGEPVKVVYVRGGERREATMTPRARK